MRIQKRLSKKIFQGRQNPCKIPGTTISRNPKEVCFSVGHNHTLPCELELLLQQSPSLPPPPGGTLQEEPEAHFSDAFGLILSGKGGRPSVTGDTMLESRLQQFNKLLLLWDSVQWGGVLLQSVWQLKSLSMDENWAQHMEVSPFFLKSQVRAYFTDEIARPAKE